MLQIYIKSDKKGINMKKIIAIISAICIILSLASCSGGKTPAPTGGESAGPEAPGTSAPSEGTESPSGMIKVENFKWNGQKEVWSVLPTTNAEGLVAINDAMGAVLEEQGWKYVKKDAAGDPTKQVTYIEDAIASGTVGAIMCAAMSVDMLQDVAVQAQEAGIVVVYLGAEPTAYQISSCVYTAYEITGMWAIDMAEAWAKQNSNVKKDDKGVPIAIDTYDDIVDGRYRSNAFRDEAEASDILYVYNESTSYGNDAQNTAYNWAENMMTANPDLRIFICYEPDAMKGVTSYLAQYAKDNKLDLADFCVINCYEDSETPALLEQAKNDPSSTAFKGYVTYGASPIDTGKKLAEEFLGIVDGSWPYGQSYYDEINAYSSFGFSQHWEMGQENPALKYKY